METSLNHVRRTTITLIRHHSGFVNVDDSFQTIEPGFDPSIDEFTESLAEYYLPEGYTVAKTIMGETAIFDPADKHCKIIMHRPTDRPQLVSGAREMPVLKRKLVAKNQSVNQVS